MKQLLYSLLIIYATNARGQASLQDTSGWQEIKTQIGHHTIVGLGEVGHGFASINEAKAAFAGMLHSEMNFGAMAFESSFTGSIISFLNNDRPDTRMKHFFYPFWNTTPVRAALQPFFEKENQAHKPLITGFDIQEDCRFQKFAQYLNNNGLVRVNADKLIQCDTILSGYIGKNVSRKGAMTSQEYALLIANYNAIAREINAGSLDDLHKKWIARSIDNRKWLCQYLTLATTREKMYYRDSLMADNISWLKKELYPDNKLILWAANTHIAELTKNNTPQWTGEWLSMTQPGNYFTVAFQKGTGDKTFYWKGYPFSYEKHSGKKFDMTIYLDKLIKIDNTEWITPCD